MHLEVMKIITIIMSVDQMFKLHTNLLILFAENMVFFNCLLLKNIKKECTCMNWQTTSYKSITSKGSWIL